MRRPSHSVGRGKLTPEQVMEIREAYWTGLDADMPRGWLAATARRYGVTGTQVRFIIEGVSWSWLPGGRRHTP